MGWEIAHFTIVVPRKTVATYDDRRGDRFQPLERTNFISFDLGRNSLCFANLRLVGRSLKWAPFNSVSVRIVCLPRQKPYYDNGHVWRYSLHVCVCVCMSVVRSHFVHSKSPNSFPNGK